MDSFIDYGEERIAFSIRFGARTARRVAIQVHPDGSVQVDAPQGATPAEVRAAVRHRARWVWQRLAEHRARTRHVLPREYVSGETHFYLGKRYLLKVSDAGRGAQGVKLVRGRLEVAARSRQPGAVRALLEDWYRRRAEQVFARRIGECGSNLQWLKTPPAFRLMVMRARWGSCSPNGELVLNPQLVKAPRHCIDYVIYHELCHLREHSHGPAYYRLLGGLLPDWERRKAELDKMAEMLLNR